MPLPPNSYTVNLTPIPGTAPRKFLFQRPKEILFLDFNLNFSPNLGQSVRIRERYQVRIQALGNKTIYTNSNRFLDNTNVGYWQHLYVDEVDEYYVERGGQMDVPAYGIPTEIYKHTSSYDWDFHIFRDYQDYFGAVISTTDSCNADLQPAAVPNGFIDETNVLDFVRLFAKKSGGNPITILAELVDLTDDTTDGFRFADKPNLFVSKTQVKAVALETNRLPTAIGDLGIYVPVGFEFVSCSYFCEIREHREVERFPFQVDPVIECAYIPGNKYPFPTAAAECPVELANFIQAHNDGEYFAIPFKPVFVSYFAVKADAEGSLLTQNSTGNGGYNQNFPPIVQQLFTCPSGATMPYWTSLTVNPGYT